MIPRNEYPRPQMVRNSWINLNGEWQFEIDKSLSCIERELYKKSELCGKIIVPFCPESKLSGVENKDFLNGVLYKRVFTLPEEWVKNRTIIHFGAVDYEAYVWVNDVLAGTHKGGFTPFSIEITDLIKDGENTVAVYAKDDVRTHKQPAGKQSHKYNSFQCYYTRITGIWQTVWLENVPKTYIKSFKITPDVDNQSISFGVEFDNLDGVYDFELFAGFEGKEVGYKKLLINNDFVDGCMELIEKHLWEIGSPELYDLKLRLVKDNNVIDEVTSYFGLRKVSMRNGAFMLNDKPVFMRLVLDQGYYPEGLYTAPSDEALKNDIEISMSLGFNGARLHEKVFEERYLYWADKLGYLVWGEYPNWGLDVTNASALEVFLPEWTEAIERDYNHPSIIGWCPFNETWDTVNGEIAVGANRQDDEVIRNVYLMTKKLDKTRPVIDTSGNYHVVTDIFDVHSYEQVPEEFEKLFGTDAENEGLYVTFPERQKYNGEPYFVSEYGGIWWHHDASDDNAWGYGERPEGMDEFIERYKGLTLTLLKNPKICGFCYTQLYDVEQEVNGLFTYSRKAKFDTETIRKINTTKAAIE